MTTARNIIKKAFQKSGIIVKSETPSADETSDALDTLNAMLSSWSNNSLMTYTRVLESFTLTPGTASYTIGTGQTFNTTRPIQIIDAFVRLATIDYPVEIIGDTAFDAFEYKGSEGRPQYLNYSNGYPTATIRLYQTPSDAYSLYIRSEKPLSTFALDDEVSLPPGWEHALIWNLAILLVPEYGQPATPEMVSIANQAKTSIARAIAKARPLDYPVKGDNGNILSGWWK